MSELVLQVKNLKKSFFKSKIEIPILRGIDFTLSKGECVAITGESGVGKSTFLHVVGTLEPPTSGKILFGPESVDVGRLKEAELSRFRNRELGFIFQFHYLLPEFTALENVMMPALIAGYSKKMIEKDARALLEFVGLEKRLTHRPTELSGGEQQRVAVARSVILRPKIILADEVTGNLDSENSQTVVDLLLELNRTTGVSLVLVTHDLTLANKMHRALIMKNGLIDH